jgi:hypothetical protein
VDQQEHDSLPYNDHRRLRLRDRGYPQGAGQAGGDDNVVFSPEALIPFGGRLLAG